MKLITADNFERVKNYLRVDGDMDDHDIKMNINAAYGYIKNSVGDDLDEYLKSLVDDWDVESFNMLVMMLTAHFYGIHSGVLSKGDQVVPYGVQSMLLQLKSDYSYFSRGQ
jgi:uncharacterized phage protein (predicted DNA packaging)